jgi:hypothetical protein
LATGIVTVIFNGLRLSREAAKAAGAKIEPGANAERIYSA